MSAHRNFSFGGFTLDLGRGALLKDGAEVRLRPKSFEVLKLLVERHGQLVTKDEFLETVWAGTVVTEGSLTQCLIDVRRALGDEGQTVIRTVPRRGYILDVPVSESDGAPTVVEKTLGGRTWQMPAVAAVLAIAAVLLWWGFAQRDVGPAPGPTTRAPPNSIAVLPFVNMSPEPDQEYFSDGISEEILNMLAQAPDLRVIARTSSFSFKGKDASVADIARKLNVAYVLEGSVRKSGQRVRITAQLVSAADSARLWSESYDRELDDTFAVQSDIATRVTAALESKMSERMAVATPDPQAHERLLRGQFFFHRRGPGDAQLAVKYYEEAVAIDPGYAQAWVGLAGACGALVFEDPKGAKEWLARQGVAARKAVEIDPGLAAAHRRLAQFYFNSGDRDSAREHAARADEIDPTYPEPDPGETRSADLAALIAEYRSKTERDPLSSAAHQLLGVHLVANGQLDEAIAEFREAIELNPDGAPDLAVEIARVEVLQKRYDEAYAEIARIPEGADRDHVLALLREAPGRSGEADAAFRRLVALPVNTQTVRLAEAYAARGEIDEAFAALDASVAAIRQERDAAMPPGPRIYWLQNEMLISPFLRGLHADPRWARLMADPF